MYIWKALISRIDTIACFSLLIVSRVHLIPARDHPDSLLDGTEDLISFRVTFESSSGAYSEIENQ